MLFFSFFRGRVLAARGDPALFEVWIMSSSVTEAAVRQAPSRSGAQTKHNLFAAGARRAA